MNTATTERLLRLDATRQMTGLGRTMIYKMVAEGAFPSPVKIGRTTMWAESEIQAWIEARKAARTAA